MNSEDQLKRFWLGIWEFNPCLHDYPEDTYQENGNYENKCLKCNVIFIGNKHRRECKLCRNERLNNV